MGSLLWLDPAHWLNELSLFWHGELPYRDYSFQYPPFVVFLYGSLLRLFGATFTNVQVITDLIDVAVIICFYLLIRRLFPPRLRFAVACFLVCVSATSLMNFNLFSYVTYSPSLQTGALGVILLLFALIGFLARKRFGYAGWTLAAVGGFIAVLSKPESAVASIFSLAVFALIVRAPRTVLSIATVVFVPAAIAYASIAYAVGRSNLLAGMSGYGLATAFCPWWPTGLGVFSIVATLGEACAFAALCSLPMRRAFSVAYGLRYRYLLWSGALGAIIYASYIAYQSKHAIFSPGLALLERVRRTLPYVVYTSPILEPMLWVCIVVFLVLLWRAFSGRLAAADAAILVLLSAPVAMSSRSLFNTTQSIFPEVSGICYPFLLVLGPYFLWRFLRPASVRYATVVVAALMFGYAAIRVAGGWPEMLSGTHYGTLYTEAGSVKLLNYDLDSKVYRYVLRHTSADDYVLDLPYGGGLNFASRRRYPIFNVQLYGLGVPPPYEQLDLDLMRQHPPRIVIGLNEANLGTYWGYGQKGDRACVCPRLVWAPDRRSWDPDRVLPVAQYIEAHYRVVETIGDRAIWAPK